MTFYFLLLQFIITTFYYYNIYYNNLYYNKETDVLGNVLEIVSVCWESPGLELHSYIQV